MSNAFFRYGDPPREAVGVRLLQYAAALLREQLGPVPALTWIPPGPGFDYADSPYLFGTRRGYGPLHIVWDTNLLIDYFQYGNALWEFGEVPARANDELEAFQILTALWVVRDIRFHVLPRVIVDAKKQLSPERRAQRVNAIERFAAALQLVGTDPRSPITRDGLLVLPESERIRALDRIPHLLDRNLIADTIALGAHVFLTNESKLLARSEDLRPSGSGSLHRPTCSKPLPNAVPSTACSHRSTWCGRCPTRRASPSCSTHSHPISSRKAPARADPRPGASTAWRRQ